MRPILILFSFFFLLLETRSMGTDSLLIRYNSLDFETVNVSTCSNFELMTGYEKEYVVSSSCHINTLKKLISHLHEKKDKYFPVRCKLYIFNSDTVRQTICMNKTNVRYNGKTYDNNDTIINFIHHLMGEYTPSNFRRFFPNFVGANYVDGTDSLFRLLNKIINKMAYSLNYSGIMIINIICKADRKGKTIDADINFVIPHNPNKKEKKIAKRLKKYVIQNIHWEKDIDRSEYDVISFPIRYSRTGTGKLYCPD